MACELCTNTAALSLCEHIVEGCEHVLTDKLLALTREGNAFVELVELYLSIIRVDYRDVPGQRVDRPYVALWAATIPSTSVNQYLRSNRGSLSVAEYDRLFNRSLRIGNRRNPIATWGECASIVLESRTDNTSTAADRPTEAAPDGTNWVSVDDMISAETRQSLKDLMEELPFNNVGLSDLITIVNFIDNPLLYGNWALLGVENIFELLASNFLAQTGRLFEIEGLTGFTPNPEDGGGTSPDIYQILIEPQETAPGPFDAPGGDLTGTASTRYSSDTTGMRQELNFMSDSASEHAAAIDQEFDFTIDHHKSLGIRWISAETARLTNLFAGYLTREEADMRRAISEAARYVDTQIASIREFEAIDVLPFVEQIREVRNEYTKCVAEAEVPCGGSAPPESECANGLEISDCYTLGFISPVIVEISGNCECLESQANPPQLTIPDNSDTTFWDDIEESQTIRDDASKDTSDSSIGAPEGAIFNSFTRTQEDVCTGKNNVYIPLPNGGYRCANRATLCQEKYGQHAVVLSDRTCVDCRDHSGVACPDDVSVPSPYIAPPGYVINDRNEAVAPCPGYYIPIGSSCVQGNCGVNEVWTNGKCQCAPGFTVERRPAHPQFGLCVSISGLIDDPNMSPRVPAERLPCGNAGGLDNCVYRENDTFFGRCVESSILKTGDQCCGNRPCYDLYYDLPDGAFESLPEGYTRDGIGAQPNPARRPCPEFLLFVTDENAEDVAESVYIEHPPVTEPRQDCSTTYIVGSNVDISDVVEFIETTEQPGAAISFEFWLRAQGGN